MKLDAETIDILKKMTFEDNKARLPEGQLDRKVYVKVNKALECLGGKWNRSAKAHIFADDPNELIANAVTFGEVVDAKKEFQFFETPDEVVSQMLEMVDIQPDDVVLEPSAGGGAIARRLLETGAEVFVCELQDDLRAKLSENDYNVVGDGNFLETWTGLSEDMTQLFDYVIANPPFSKGQDVDHVRHMYELLRPGGRVVTIMPPSWTFRNDKRYREFREWAYSLPVAEWFELPDGAFKSSGTMVKTGILMLEKPR